MAGGVPVSASMDDIKVERIEAHTKRVMLNVKLPAGTGERPLRDMVGTFWVKDGDRVSVSPSCPTVTARFICKDTFTGPAPTPIVMECSN